MPTLIYFIITNGRVSKRVTSAWEFFNASLEVNLSSSNSAKRAFSCRVGYRVVCYFVGETFIAAQSSYNVRLDNHSELLGTNFRSLSNATWMLEQESRGVPKYGPTP
ncbi:indole-diterpene biosynthesis protein [Moniliophthora roreri]|nr:indole-diterpene biosynthesis protein [Moniliophthora roreri]